MCGLGFGARTMIVIRRSLRWVPAVVTFFAFATAPVTLFTFAATALVTLAGPSYLTDWAQTATSYNVNILDCLFYVAVSATASQCRKDKFND